jgi:hypothetical protein
VGQIIASLVHLFQQQQSIAQFLCNHFNSPSVCKMVAATTELHSQGGCERTSPQSLPGSKRHDNQRSDLPPGQPPR